MKLFRVLFISVLLINLMLFADIVKAQCQADFTYTDLGNGNISFTNTSLGGVDFYWAFDDGSDTLDVNPIHNFTVGSYLVCLTIEDSTIACSSTFCDSLVVDTGTEPDSCMLYASYTYLNDSLGTYTFNSNVTGGTAPYSYSWSFGDITPYDYNQNPTHTFYYDAMYDICLIVSDSLGCNYVVCDSIVIDGLNTCNVFSGFNYTDNGGGNYLFLSTSTGDIVNYFWRFGSAFSNLLTPSYSFPMDGIYLVSLYVADSNNFCNDYATEYITVSGVLNPVECNSSFTIYTDSAYNGVYVMNTSGGNNLSYFWNFGDGNTSTLAYPNYTYGSGGPYELCLTVTSDSSCTSTYCDSIATGGVVNKGGFSMNILAPNITNVNDGEHLVSTLNIYPNPTQDYLHISSNGSTIKQVSIVDINGRLTYHGNYQSMIDVSSFSKGLYIITILTDKDEQLHYKIIKE